MAWIMRAGSRSVSFGEGVDGLGLINEPSVSIDYESQVATNPRGDGRRMGVDTIAGQVVSLTVEARPDSRPLVDVVRELVAVWRGDEVRRKSGELARLVSHSGLTAYGRPRPVAPDQQNKLFGLARAELVFEAVDDLWYGVTVSTRVYFSIPETGGLTFPAEAPFTFDSGPTQRNGVVTVEGTAEAWPVFTIQGPVANPSIRVAGVGELKFEVTLAYDQTLTVDTRPWARSVKRGSAPLPGSLLASGARLSDMALSPGSYEVVLRGYDPTGTGYLDVQVAPAFTSF